MIAHGCIRKLSHVPRRWAQSYLMWLARREVNGTCTLSATTITDDDKNVCLSVTAWWPGTRPLEVMA